MERMERKQSLCSLLEPLKTFSSEKPLLAHRQGKIWSYWSAQRFLDSIQKFSLFLYESGIRKGDRVGIFSPSSPYWLAADFAILSLGAISVPFLPKISHEHFDYQFKEANLKALFIFEFNQLENLPPSCQQTHIPIVYGYEKYPDIRKHNFHHLDDIMKLEAIHSLPQETIEPHDLACIIFTSGSSGTPKGVMLSHDNLLSQLEAAHICFPLKPEQSTALSLLPIAHVFEKMVVYYYLSCQLTIHFCSDPKWMLASMQEVNPHIMTFVPRLLEKAFSSIRIKINKLPPSIKAIVTRILDISMKQEPQDMNFLWKILGHFLLYKKVRSLFGSELVYAIVGGAYFDESLHKFFTNVGIPVYVGYGLTEASPVLTTNCPQNNKIGTVGTPYPGVDVKISENNEILTKGRGVMQGYLNDPEKTKASLTQDGWLKTGDQGSFTPDGFLKISGRLKDLLKTSNGKFVVPGPIEQSLCLCPLIDQALIIAEGKPYTTALIFLDPTKSPLESPLTPVIIKEIETFIESINHSLNSWEQIKKFKIITQPISIENGDMTPTMKLKRHHLIEKFHENIEQMYEENGELHERTSCSC